jgi:hypothetical protein
MCAWQRYMREISCDSVMARAGYYSKNLNYSIYQLSLWYNVRVHGWPWLQSWSIVTSVWEFVSMDHLVLNLSMVKRLKAKKKKNRSTLLMSRACVYVLCYVRDFMYSCSNYWIQRNTRDRIKKWYFNERDEFLQFFNFNFNTPFKDFWN